jgi:peptidyl-prolyl cis-trans isomerase A (cyclophilin A)
MKNRLSAFLALVLFAVVGLGVAFSNPSATNAQAPAFDPILLTPSKLIERAPAEFDAKFVTTKGEFTVHVKREWAPHGADRFYNLVKHHYFDACPFFRVISGFMAQFGLTPYPEVNKAWMNANIQDDPVKASNTRGKITFAQTNQPNTRATQLFINYADRNAQLDKSGFAPIGEVTSGMEVVDKLNSEYGDHADQEKITMEGGAFLKRAMPHLDYMNTVRLVGVPAAGAGR